MRWHVVCACLESAFACADYANQEHDDFAALRGGTDALNAWYGQSYSAAEGVFIVWVLAWHFRSLHGRLRVNNWFAVPVVTCAISLTSFFKRKETKFFKNKTVIRSNSLFYYVFSSSNSLFFMTSLQFSDLSDMQEPARSMLSTLAVPPSPRHNRDGSKKVWTCDKRTHHHKRFDLRRFVRTALWVTHHAFGLNCAILICEYELSQWYEACGIALFVTVPKGFCAC